jgi:cytoskeletal protein CcmA (bactofilin family)
MRRAIRLICLVLPAFAQQGLADAPQTRERSLGEDRFVAGGSAEQSDPVKGDLVAAGGELRLAAPVAGDVLAAGGRLLVESKVGQDLYAAGGEVLFDGMLARNARIAGGSVDIGRRARIDGNASFAGGRVEMRGSVGGYLQVAGGRVLIDGPVRGDVEAAAGELELGPQARVGGKLTYRGGAALRRDPSAQVAGGVDEVQAYAPQSAARGAARGAFIAWTLGLMLAAAVLVWLLPGFSARTADAARARFGWSLLTGFIVLVVTPVAIVVLLATLIGIPLALLSLLGYLALLLAGYLAAGMALGEAALRRWRPGARAGWRAAAAALGVLAIGLLALLPWVGGFVVLIALLSGAGAVALALRSAWRGPAATAS